MIHLDAFWSIFYTNCNCLYDRGIKSNILKLHMFNSAAKKVDPEIFMQTFLGVSTPVTPPPLNTGLAIATDCTGNLRLPSFARIITLDASFRNVFRVSWNWLSPVTYLPVTVIAIRGVRHYVEFATRILKILGVGVIRHHQLQSDSPLATANKPTRRRL